MLGLLKKIFGGNSTDWAALVDSGAKMIDVRSKGEFDAGHAKGCVNIPLDQIERKVTAYKKTDTIIVCCRSGMRSASAAGKLKVMGFTNVHNAGAWQTLNGLKK